MIHQLGVTVTQSVMSPKKRIRWMRRVDISSHGGTTKSSFAVSETVKFQGGASCIVLMVQKHCNDTAVSKQEWLGKNRQARRSFLEILKKSQETIHFHLVDKQVTAKVQKETPHYSNLERPCGSGMVPRCYSSTLPSISCHWLRMQGIMVENMVAHRKLVISTCNVLHSYRLCHALSDPGTLKKETLVLFNGCLLQFFPM